MLKKTRLVALLLSGALALVLSTGCSDDSCEGTSLHPDLDQEGSDSPIDALEAWLSGPDALPDAPADAEWTVIDSGEKDPDEVIIEHPAGNGWWVSVAQTSQGGWVVSAATDDAKDCEDELADL